MKVDVLSTLTILWYMPLDNDYRKMAKSYPDNFKILIYIIEFIGRFKHNSVEYILVIHPGLERKVYFIMFSDLLRVSRIVVGFYPNMSNIYEDS